MDAPTLSLLISCLSLVVATAALTWNVVQWLLSTGRAKVTLLHGFRTHYGIYAGPVTKSGAGFDLDSLRAQGIPGTGVVGIEVINTGRAPLSVQKVTLHSRGSSISLTPVGMMQGPALPHRIEPGENASWYVDTKEAATLNRLTRSTAKKRATGTYMSAQTGTRKTHKTRATLKV